MTSPTGRRGGARRASAPGFYEFFAGGGMARAGLGPGWSCLFANDFDPAKARAYAENWGETGLRVGDIRGLGAADLPGAADLAWASFPCQDLSLAGLGRGLRGERSGTLFAMFDLIRELAAEGRAPRIVAVENVCGALTSREGRDFQAICAQFAEAGYRYGALVIDAEGFVPQSRPRLFVIGIRDLDPPDALLAGGPEGPYHTPALIRACARAPGSPLWWRLPPPPARSRSLADLLETDPADAPWRTDAETARLIAAMSPRNLAKLETARASGAPQAGCVFLRTRKVGNAARPMAEARFDGVAGCLRTPGGGSSRQILLVVEGARVRSRLLSPREAARLMGLPDTYALPGRYGEALHLTGDGVCVDVVRHLASALFEPLLSAGAATARAA